MPHNRKPKPAQHDPRTVASTPTTPPATVDEQRRALQMSMDMRY
jgi:hypothetical protein